MLGRAAHLFGESRNQVASNMVHGTVIEVVWTVTPTLILIVVAIPSFALLYSIDEVVDPAITIKCIGHQ
jgi:cytochrome c oxidase subunit 2